VTNDGKPCYVCTNTDESIHMHHIIPREYGGLNGPVVPLHANCHNRIHKLADAIKTGSDFEQSKPKFKNAREMELVIVIVRAKQAHEADPNRRTNYTFAMNSVENLMVERLALHWGLSKVNSIKKSIFNNYLEVTQHS